MRFEDKLITLRQKNAMSKKNLAEKLDVSEEIINEWESGKSKPDNEQMTEISKIFNIEIIKLTDDNVNLKNNNSNKASDKGENHGIKIAILIVAIFIVVLIIIRLTFAYIQAKQREAVINAAEKINQDMEVQMKEQEEKLTKFKEELEKMNLNRE